MGVLTGILALTYPFLIWFSLTHWGTRTSALLLLVLAVPVAVRRKLHQKTGIGVVFGQIVGVFLLVLLTLITEQAVFLQQLPVLISLFLFVTFVVTLYRPPPMIERYARIIDGDLSPAEQEHCRKTTYVWIGFLLANAIVAECLALFSTYENWAWYSGGVAYLFIGLIFSVEYVIRKARFGRLGTGLIDRFLSRVLSGQRKEP